MGEMADWVNDDSPAEDSEEREIRQMSGKSINELGVETESYGVAPRKVEDMPAQFGGFRAIPQPDRYRFRLPANLAQVWEVTNPLVVEGFGDGQPHRFAYAKFDEDNPLVIIGASERNKDWVNEPFQIRISSYPRNRAKKDEAAQFASALDCLPECLREQVVERGGTRGDSRPGLAE